LPESPAWDFRRWDGQYAPTTAFFDQAGGASFRLKMESQMGYTPATDELFSGEVIFDRAKGLYFMDDRPVGRW
jgi:hypothetical protein